VLDGVPPYQLLCPHMLLCEALILDRAAALQILARYMAMPFLRLRSLRQFSLNCLGSSERPTYLSGENKKTFIATFFVRLVQTAGLLGTKHL